MTVWKRAGREPRALIREWHSAVNRIAARHGDRIELRVNRYWIAFRSEAQQRVFAEIRPSRRRVEVFILPEHRGLSDPAGIARRAPHTQGWNWFRTKFSIVGNGHARDALQLIRQSYEFSNHAVSVPPQRKSRGRQSRIVPA